MKIAKQKVELIDSMGSDLSVVNAARVSFAKESDFEYEYGMDGLKNLHLNDKDDKLIHYLAKHRHKSPFNHAFMSFRVKAPIFVARQLVKHEYLPWNEVSRRYVTEEPEFYFPSYWRKKADNVKQGSSLEEALYNTDHMFATKDHVVSALYLYNSLLKGNVCAEQARMVLPQNVMTEWIWSGSLYAFAKMCKLRLDSHTQKETREVAQMISEEAEKLFPTSWPALLEYAT
jgi:thymidylate synthase (FAD)